MGIQCWPETQAGSLAEQGRGGTTQQPTETCRKIEASEEEDSWAGGRAWRDTQLALTLL